MPATPNEIPDALSEFSQGMNSGVAPVLLPKNQLAFASNATVRGTFLRPRPARRKLDLDFGGDSALQNAVTKALFQGAAYAAPDSGSETLVAAIAGRLFQFTPNAGVATVAERTGGNPQSVVAPQEWLWQSEQFIIWNDGFNNPVFFNLNDNTTRRSTGTFTTPGGTQTTTTTNGFTVPGAGVPIQITVATTYRMNSFPVLHFAGFGDMLIDTVDDLIHVTITPGGAGAPWPAPGTFIPAGTVISFTYPPVTGNELPVGKMGVYGQGRNWVVLEDNIQFIAGDLVGTTSGTPPDFRDSVLRVVENAFLVGGGTFRVPGNAGKIQAICETNALDASMGQGPIEVHTANRVFTCQSPVDRLTWQNLTNPILPVSVIGRGGKGQNSTVKVNGDVIFRAPSSVSTVIYARRDFDTWGNVPISREVERIIKGDAQNLLQFSSAVEFDNRLLMTVAPTTHALGVYHQGLVVILFDPLSSMRGKAPSVWDGLWPQQNVLQIIKGDFGGIERCYAFVLNLDSNAIELWEYLPSDSDIILDNDSDRIIWNLESPVLFREPDSKNRKFKRLVNGELMIDNLQGQVDFEVQYKPDDYPCWTTWFTGSECAVVGGKDQLPGFKPRIGLGEPSGKPCDAFTNRPFREAFYFQFRIIVTGQCTFKGANFLAIEIPQPKFEPPNCAPICA